MIRLTNICKIFNAGKSNEKVALNNINLEIADGELVAITGKSGAGKSTLMNVVACLDAPTSGEYILNGEDVTSVSAADMARLRNRNFGIITQFPFLIDNITPLENVVVPLMYDRRDKKERYKRASAALSNVGIDPTIKRRTVVLSGGEQQRVAIARAIVNNPNVILADEPTGSLDSENADIVMKILTNINKEGKTVIIITHDEEIAEKCSRRVVMCDGAI